MTCTDPLLLETRRRILAIADPWTWRRAVEAVGSRPGPERGDTRGRIR